MSSNKPVDRRRKSTPSARRNANGNSSNCWTRFPLVVTEVIDESVSRMNAKKVEDKIKKENMKAAIRSIIQSGEGTQKMAEQYRLCKTTLAKYHRIAKYKLSDSFGEEADVEFVLKEHDGETLTYSQLLAISKKPEVTTNNNRKRKDTPIASERADTVAASDGPTHVTFAKKPPIPSQSEFTPTSIKSSSPSNSFMVDEILASQPLNLELKQKHPLMIDQQQNTQMLVTRRIEPVPFEGTLSELRTEFAQVLQQYYYGNVAQLATLMANFVRYEYELRWQETMFGIPRHLMESAYSLLARRFQLKNLRLIDVDEGLAEMDVNIGSTSHNWLGQ